MTNFNSSFNATRKKYSSEFKAKVALAAVKGDKTLTELCKQYGVHANVISKWKAQLMKNSSTIFSSESDSALKKHSASEADISRLHAKIGELLVERDFLKKTLQM